MISTGCVAAGTGTPGVGAEISEARSRASEYRPRRHGRDRQAEAGEQRQQIVGGEKHDDARDDGDAPRAQR